MPQLGYPNLQKPLRGAQIDWTHPYTHGLTFAWVFNELGGAPVELVSRSLPSSSTAFAWGSNSYGATAKFNGSSTDATYTGLPAIGSAVSFAGACTPTSLSLNGMLIERSPVNSTWELLIESSSFILRGNSPGNPRFSAAITGSAGSRFSWGISDSAIPNTTAIGYINGTPWTNTASGNYGGPVISNTNAIHLGNYDNSGYFFSGTQEYLYVWNYAVPGSQLVSIASNPYQFFRSPIQPSWLYQAAALTSVSGFPFLSTPSFWTGRADATSYQVGQSLQVQDNRTSASPVFPGVVTGPVRAAQSAYVTTNHPQIGNFVSLVQPAAPVFPSTASAAARAAAVAYFSPRQIYASAPAVSLGRFQVDDPVNLAFMLPVQAVAPSVAITSQLGSSTAQLQSVDGTLYAYSVLLPSARQQGAYTATVTIGVVSFQLVVSSPPGRLLSVSAVSGAPGWQVFVQMQAGGQFLGVDP